MKATTRSAAGPRPARRAATRSMLQLALTLPICTALFGWPGFVDAQPAPTQIGIVLMHGKGGRPERLVNTLAEALEREGFQVASLEMPWSGRRHYDVTMAAGVDEISRALDAMRARGARKVFVAGHSQGGVFALHYGGQHSVDGVLAIAPGGQVDGPPFAAAISAHVARAREMVAAGRGDEPAEFADYEGARGTHMIASTAALYLDWFDPAGAHTGQVFQRLRPGTPVLHVAPLRDYPALQRSRQRNFAALPPHALNRLVESNSDHANAPAAAASEAIAWIYQVAGMPARP